MKRVMEIPACARFSCHREAHLQQLTSLIDGPAGSAPQLIFLTGGTEGEHASLVDCAVARANTGDSGQEVVRVRVLIDQECASQSALIAAEVARQLAEGHPRLWERIRDIDIGLEAPIPILKIGKSKKLGELMDLLNPAGVSASDASPGSALPALLAVCGRFDRVVLHVVHADLLNDVARAAMHEAIRSAPGLSTICSGTPAHRSYRAPAFDTVHLAPLSKAELMPILDRTFPDHAFTDGFASALVAMAHGQAEVISNVIQALIDASEITEVQGRWELIIAEDSPEFGRRFAPLRDVVASSLDALPPELRDAAGTFLQCAALCGAVAPAHLLFGQLGVDEELLTNAVDEHLACDGSSEASRFAAPWLIDLGFNHPGIEGTACYAFRNPVIRGVVLGEMDEWTRRRHAERILEVAASNALPRTRTTAELYRQLAFHAGDSDGSEEKGTELAWWVAEDEAEQFSAMLRELLRAGRLGQGHLWRTYYQTRREWPPYRSLALLDSMWVPPDTQSESEWIADNAVVEQRYLRQFHGERCGLLFSIGRYAESHAEGVTALALTDAKEEPGRRGDLLYQLILAELFVPEAEDDLLAHLDELIGLVHVSDTSFGPSMIETLTAFALAKNRSRLISSKLANLKASLVDAFVPQPDLHLFTGGSSPEVLEHVRSLHRSEALHAAGRHAEALDVLRQAIQSVPEESALAFTISQCARHCIGCGCDEGTVLLEQCADRLENSSRRRVFVALSFGMAARTLRESHAIPLACYCIRRARTALSGETSVDLDTQRFIDEEVALLRQAGASEAALHLS